MTLRKPRCRTIRVVRGRRGARDREAAADRPSTLRLAHRGQWRDARENSLPAVLAAVTTPGCDGVEFDVRAAADGTPVLAHDATMIRLHGFDDPLAALSSQELQGIGVPRLQDVLAALPATAFVNIELKDDPGDGAIDVIDAAGRGQLDNGVVSSFNARTLARVRRGRPRWACWLNADHACDVVLRRAVQLGCTGVSVGWQSVNRRAMGAATAAGLEMAAWTVRGTAARAAMTRLGVRAICAEGPALD